MGYVCGAVRVTTDEQSPCLGPRAHVVGFLGGLADNGVDVRTYLVGDQVPPSARRATTYQATGGGLARRLAVDVARLGLRHVSAQRARTAVGPGLHLLYERQASFQDIGRRAARSGVPWVIESNGPFWYEAATERKSLALAGHARRLELAAYRDADLVVAVSNELKAIIVEATGRDEHDVLVVPNATDPGRFDPGSVMPHRLGQGLTVGFAGYLAEWAGIDRLLRAAGQLRRSGVVIDVVIIGDGPAAASLHEVARAEGVEDRTTFTGTVPWTSIPSLLAGLDLAYSGQRAMAIGSMYHSPQKIYEYMAMGVPVVASAFDDARRLVTPDTGWLFAADDADDLASVLRTAIVAPDRVARGARAREVIVAAHSWAARTSELLDELARRDLIPDRAALAVNRDESPLNQRKRWRAT